MSLFLPYLLFSAVMVLDQYRAVADYTKQDKKELSFKAGDIFEVIEKNDNGASRCLTKYCPD